MKKQPDDELIRELYAKFGLAYYQSECLHRSLCIILAWSGLPPLDLILRPRMEERLVQAFSLTFGEVIHKLEGMLPTELTGKLREAVKARNFLAHHFWFERVHLMFSAQHVHQLIDELNDYAKLFDHLDTLVSEWLEARRWELGITDEILQASMNRVLAGADEPLPDRRGIRELEKKLGKRQRLVRVWEFSLDDSRKPPHLRASRWISVATVRCRARLG